MKEIESLLEKIDNLRVYEEKGLLECDRERLVLNEIKSFNFESVIFDEFKLLMIKKFKQKKRPTLYTTKDSGTFKIRLGDEILDWENILKELIGANDLIIKSNYENNNLSYDFNNSKLTYNGKIINFSQTIKQKEFIENLFNNLNKWVELKDGKQTLKDIREKMKKQPGINKYTSLETKQLLQSFDDSGNTYFIMIG